MAITEKEKILEVNEIEIPDELKVLDHWVLWNAILDEKTQQFKKIPYQMMNQYAKANDKSTWSIFYDVKSVYLRGNYDGIGFVLSDEDDFIVLDLDNAVNPDTLEVTSDLGKEMLQLTYCEISPSRTGLHAFFKGELPKDRKKKRTDLDIELYDNARFMTVTGYSVGQSEINDDQEILNNLYERFFKNEDFAFTVEYSEQVTEPGTTIDDEVLIQKMTSSKNGQKISDLLKGNYEEYFSSPSEAVHSLLWHLAFWTRKNRQQMESIFIKYNNLTDKWDSRRGNTTWGQLELEKAIQMQPNVYDPKAKKKAEKPHEWMESLRYKTDKHGNETEIKKSIYNVELILQNDDELKDILKFDNFEYVTKLKRMPYWRSKNDTNMFWQDIDTIHLKSHIDVTYDFQFSTEMIHEAIEREAYKHKYHPIKDLIESNDWDGTERIENLFIDYVGAANTHYTKQVARKWMIAAVTRIYKPGTKFDNVPILYGSQGSGKSTLAAKIGGDYYNQSLKSFTGDEAYRRIQGSWIVELEELAAFQRSTIDEIKSFISAIVDVFRNPYARRVERRPRQAVFIGTTNNYEFNKDTTGGRRWWPVSTNKEKAIKNVHEDLTQDIVQQMYAEAYTYYKSGESLLLDDEAEIVAFEMQQEHTEEDSLIGEIEMFLEKPIRSDYWKLNANTMIEVTSSKIIRNNISLLEDGKLISIANGPPGQYVWRDKVSAIEIWKIMMKRDDTPSRSEMRKINDALRNCRYFVEKKPQIRFTDDIGRQSYYVIDLKPYYEELNNRLNKKIQKLSS